MTIQKPCFPSFFNWQPVPNKPGLRHKGNSTTGVYSTIADEDARENPVCASRGKFARIVIAQPFVVIPRLVYRTVSLLTGDFIQPGMEKGLYAHQLKQQQWLAGPRDISQFPGGAIQQREILKGIAVEFCKNTAKIALYAVVAIPLWAIAFYGLLCNPYDADVFFGTIENWTARDFIPISKNPRWRLWQLQIGDYIAFCKQTNDVLDQKHLHRVFKSYHPETLRSLMRFLRVELQNKKAFFSNEKISVDEICSSLRLYKDQLKPISKSDSAELKDDGTLKREKDRSYEGQIWVAKKLNDLKTALREIELNRELAVEAAVAGDKSSESEWRIERFRAQVAATWKALNRGLEHINKPN